jgi:general secretion pathway protein I
MRRPEDTFMRWRLRGFTLLEVMIALAVVSIGLVAASSSIAQLTANGVYLRDKTMGHWIAMNKLAELRLAEAWPGIGESDDEIEFGSQSWHWTAAVSETQVENLRRVDLTVARKDKKGERVVAKLAGFIGPPRIAAGLPPPWTGDTTAGPPGGPGPEEGESPEEQPPPEDEGDDPGEQDDSGSGDDSGDSGDSGDEEQP